MGTVPLKGTLGFLLYSTIVHHGRSFNSLTLHDSFGLLLFVEFLMSSSLSFQYLVTLNMASRDETSSLSVTESFVSSTRILTRTAWSSRAAAQVR